MLRSFSRLSLTPLPTAASPGLFALQKRFKAEYGIEKRVIFPKIRGPPLREKYDPYKHYPEPNKYNWRPILPQDKKYTIMPLKIRKLHGRHPETNKIIVKTLKGGNKKYYRWVDNLRTPNPDGSVKEEKVFNVRYDPLRTAKLMLVAGGDSVRWMTASENILPGDIIRTHGEIPRNPIHGKEGDAYPVGALAVGTLIHNFEVIPGEGGVMCRAAGTCAEIIRRVGNKIHVRLSSKQEICIDQKCMAVVGRVSNIYHYTVNRMCPQRSRWYGNKSVPGVWHRKDGYCGRKVHPPKPLKDYVLSSKLEKQQEPEIYLLQPFN